MKIALNIARNAFRTNLEMTKNIQQNDGVGEKSTRQRKTSPRPKKQGSVAPLELPADSKEIIDVPAIQTPAPERLEDEWVGKIRDLENRLREQEALVAERDADLDAAKADAEALAETVSGQIRNLQDQLKFQEELLARREAELESFRELLNAETEETRRRREARNRSSSETTRLIEEQREAKLALAKFEMEEWHIIGRRNAWKRAFRAVQRLFEKPRRNHEDETLKEQTP